MSSNSKKKQKGILSSLFWRVYLAVVAVAVVAIVIGLIWFNGVVRDYEISQPAHAAEEVARLFVDGDYDRLYDLDTAARELSGGDKALYVDSLTELAEGKSVTWREAYSPSDDERRYAVSLAGDRLATFTLVPSGQTTAHGNTLWKLGSVTTNVAIRGTEAAGDVSAAPYRISAPAGYTVTVNGRALAEANVISSGASILPEGFLPAGVPEPTMVEYGFYDDGNAPQIAVTDPSGAPAEVVESGGNTWECPLKENAELRTQYSDAIISLATQIAKYTVDDLSKSKVLKNTDSGSPAQTVLNKFSNSWAPTHRTSTVSDAVVSDFYVLSEDCFTCHVEFTFTLTSRRGNDYVYPTSYTLCVVRRNGKGKLYNLTFN